MSVSPRVQPHPLTTRPAVEPLPGGLPSTCSSPAARDRYGTEANGLPPARGPGAWSGSGDLSGR